MNEKHLRPYVEDGDNRTKYSDSVSYQILCHSNIRVLSMAILLLNMYAKLFGISFKNNTFYIFLFTVEYTLNYDCHKNNLLFYKNY